MHQKLAQTLGILILTAALLAIVLVTQLLSPVWVSNVTADAWILPDDTFVSQILDSARNTRGDAQSGSTGLPRNVRPLPSLRSGDYRRIRVSAKLTNTGFWEAIGFDGAVDARLLTFVRIIQVTEQVAPEFLPAFSQQQTYLAGFDLYTGDLSNDEIRAYLQNIQVSAPYRRVIGGEGSITINLKDADYHFD